MLLAGADPADRDRRALVPVKHSLAPDAGAIGYRIVTATIPCGIETARIEWTGQTDLTAATILAPEPAAGHEDPAPRLAEATEWLREALAKGLRPARQLLAEARKDGISERTLDRAKASMRVQAMRIPGGGWGWALPDQSATGDGNMGANHGTQVGGGGHVDSPFIAPHKPERPCGMTAAATDGSHGTIVPFRRKGGGDL